MADMIRLALRRKIAAAEAVGDFERVELLRERLNTASPSPEPVTVAPAPVGLDAVEFASSVARAAADEAGMSPESFEGAQQSSAAGFTKADVERIATATDQGDEE